MPINKSILDEEHDDQLWDFGLEYFQTNSQVWSGLRACINLCNMHWSKEPTIDMFIHNWVWKAEKPELHFFAHIKAMPASIRVSSVLRGPANGWMKAKLPHSRPSTEFLAASTKTMKIIGILFWQVPTTRIGGQSATHTFWGQDESNVSCCEQNFNSTWHWVLEVKTVNHESVCSVIRNGDITYSTRRS